MVRELRSELSDAPTNIHANDFSGMNAADSQLVARQRHEEAEVREYEETNFTRLKLNKAQLKEQRKKNAAQSFVDELQAFDDFSQLYSVATQKAADPAEEKMAALRKYMQSVERRSSKKERNSAAEDLTPRADAEERASRNAERKQRRSRDEAEEQHDESPIADVELPEVDPLYDEARVKGQKKRQRKAAAAQSASAAEAEAQRQAASEDSAQQGEKRQAGYDIVKNRGLTRERKKIDRNPRVKNREKFRRAVIRRKGQVREMRSVEGSYGGETSGIKKNVSHSVRFK